MIDAAPDIKRPSPPLPLVRIHPTRGWRGQFNVPSKRFFNQVTAVAEPLPLDMHWLMDEQIQLIGSAAGPSATRPISPPSLGRAPRAADGGAQELHGLAAANSSAAEKQLRAAGIEPAGGDAEALRKALQREIDKVNEVVKNAGIEPQ
jgi:hypothetical protein